MWRMRTENFGKSIWCRFEITDEMLEVIKDVEARPISTIAVLIFKSEEDMTYFKLRFQL